MVGWGGFWEGENENRLNSCVHRASGRRYKRRGGEKATWRKPQGEHVERFLCWQKEGEGLRSYRVLEGGTSPWRTSLL